MTPGGAASDVALLIIDVQVGLLSPVWRVEALLATLAEPARELRF